MEAVATPRKMGSIAISEDAETLNWQEIRKRPSLEGGVQVQNGLGGLCRVWRRPQLSAPFGRNLTCENSESTEEEYGI